MDSINSVIQLFEYEQLSTLIKSIERIRQIFVSATLKFLLHIYESIIKSKKQVSSKLFLKCQTITNDKKLVN